MNGKRIKPEPVFCIKILTRDNRMKQILFFVLKCKTLNKTIININDKEIVSEVG